MSNKFKISYADGTENTIVADEDFVKKIISDGDTYEAIVGAEPTNAEIEMNARQWRNKALAGSDFIVPITDHPQRDAYLLYRQKLRDWPADADNFPGTRPTIGS